MSRELIQYTTGSDAMCCSAWNRSAHLGELHLLSRVKEFIRYSEPSKVHAAQPPFLCM